MTAPFFIGIDIGTQGARVVLTDSKGNLVASGEEVFALSDRSREEQSPSDWWNACLRSLQAVIAEARDGINIREIMAVSVTSTSGTVIPLDANHEPLHDAIMYSDKRSSQDAALCREAALKFHSTGYTGFNSSSGLSKMLWFVRTFPEKAEKICRWIHAADYLAGKLSGRWGITDFTNALKSGFDLHLNQWPAYIYNELPVQREWLPEVVASGTPIGTVQPLVALALGLPGNVQVVAGMTDGCASQIASGAVNPGEWNTTIGTTLVVKGVTRQEIIDPHERLYSHRHPDGYWMPGGAGNIGADWVAGFPGELEVLTKAAGHLVPTGKLSYPLRQHGERFPFIAPDARGFEPEGLLTAERFAAAMEGVAYIERYAYKMIENLSGEKVNAVYTAGGASKNELWLRIRSTVLNLPIIKMKHVNGAFGAAILAASKTQFNSLVEATKQMTQIEQEIHPQPEWIERYGKSYGQFLGVLQEKGYIKREIYA